MRTILLVLAAVAFGALLIVEHDAADWAWLLPAGLFAWVLADLFAGVAFPAFNRPA